jgi:hypothetical protein
MSLAVCLLVGRTYCLYCGVLFDRLCTVCYTVLYIVCMNNSWREFVIVFRILDVLLGVVGSLRDKSDKEGGER